MSMMRVTIKSWAGVETDGVLLLSCGLTLRLALLGSDDAAELHFRGGHWFRENGEFVEIEFHGVPDSDTCGIAGDSMGDGVRSDMGEGRSTWLN
jgi:hypothetical protein